MLHHKSAASCGEYIPKGIQELINFHQKIIEGRPVLTNPDLPNVGIVNLNRVVTTIPDYLMQLLISNQGDEILLPDTLVFCLDISITREHLGFKFTKTIIEKGNCVSRGAVEIDAERKKALVADCEFMYNRNHNNLAQELADLIRSYFSEKEPIGGPIMINETTKEMTKLLYDPDEVKRTGNKWEFRNSKGEWNERFSFVDYPNKKDAKLYL
jgi:hypothetical protein